MQLDTALASEAPRVAPAPDIEAMRRETVDWVRHSIARLPEKIRGAMTLFYIEGLTVSEAARCLEIREGALRKRLQYGRKSVGEELFAHFDPQALPESEKCEQKARVLAALPLATAPWKAGAVAGTATAGVGALTKTALTAATVVTVTTAVVVAGIGWRPAWHGASPSGNTAVNATEHNGVPALDISSKRTAETTPGLKSVVPAPRGDLALTVTFRVPDSSPQNEGPPAANTHLWLVPFRVNRATCEAQVRQAGANPEVADVLMAYVGDPRYANTPWASLLPKAGLTQEEFLALVKRVNATPRIGKVQRNLMEPLLEEAREVVTDAQGRITVTNLTSGPYQLFTSKPGAETVSGNSFSVQAGKRAEVKIPIEDPVSAIQGAVVDAKTGKALKGVVLTLGEIASDTSALTSQSGDDGRFAFSHTATGYGPFTVGATSDTYAPVTVRGERRSSTPTLVDVRFDTPRAVVTGRVTNADGTPAADVYIMRSSLNGDNAHDTARTDADGHYVMPHDGGRFTLYAKGSNLKSESVTLDLTMDQVATQDFVFPPCGRIVIELHAPESEPAPDQIRNLLLISRQGVSGMLLDKVDGVFTLDHIKPESYTIVFPVEGYDGVRLDIEVTAKPEEQRSIVPLKRSSGGVRVRVVDASGQPAANADFHVEFTKAYYASGGRFTGRTSCFYLAGTADANGVALLKGLPPGEYSLEKGEAIVNFVAPANEEVVLCLAPSKVETEPAYLTLDKDDILAVDEKGAELPLLKKSMEIFIVSASGMVSDSRIELGSNTLYAIKGGYTASVTNIDLSPPLFAERKNGGDFNSPVKAVFGQGGTITGYLTDEAGEPVGDRRLNVLPAELLDVAAADWSKNDSRWNSFMRALAQGATTQADGSFRLEFLPEGQYYVTAGARDGVFPIEGNPVEVRRGADTGPITLTENADDKIGRP